MTLSLGTLYILRKCLHAQQMNVGDPGFEEMAPQAIMAKAELDAAIAEAEKTESPEKVG